ncbi:MAG: IS3 family transposase [Actinomycetota bacterium]
MAQQKHPSSKRYPPEVKARAIQLVLTTIEQQGERHGVVSRIARQLDIGPETLRHWVRQAEIDNGTRAGVTTEERARIAELEQENRELRRANQILKEASVFFAPGARSAPEMTRFIDERRDRFQVELLCRTLGASPSTYYARRSRPPSARAITDAWLHEEIERVFKANYSVYGARKVWRQLHREGITIGRDRVARLMRQAGLHGVRRGRKHFTTRRDEKAARPPDLVERDFTAQAPDRLWLADITYVRTWAGFCHVAFVEDAFSRMIVGWSIATHLRTSLATEALEMAIWRRGVRVEGLIHHSDAGGQYTSVAYSERLASHGIAPSVGSVGDSFDNAMAESAIGLYKTELIRRHGPWRSHDQVEIATLEYIDWFNFRRLHGEIGHIPPAEFEEVFYASKTEQQIQA